MLTVILVRPVVDISVFLKVYIMLQYNSIFFSEYNLA